MPKNLNLDIVDEVELVKSDDAFEMARKLSLEEGILGGISTGATVTAALRIARVDRKWKERTLLLSEPVAESVIYPLLWPPKQRPR